jgi:hypothetical protein
VHNASQRPELNSLIGLVQQVKPGPAAVGERHGVRHQRPEMNRMSARAARGGAQQQRRPLAAGQYGLA